MESKSVFPCCLVQKPNLLSHIQLLMEILHIGLKSPEFAPESYFCTSAEFCLSAVPSIGSGYNYKETYLSGIKSTSISFSLFSSVMLLWKGKASHKNHTLLQTATTTDALCWERLWNHLKVTASYQCSLCALCFQNFGTKLIMKPWKLVPGELRVLYQMIQTEVIVEESNCNSSSWFGLDWWRTGICSE